MKTLGIILFHLIKSPYYAASGALWAAQAVYVGLGVRTLFLLSVVAGFSLAVCLAI